MHTYPINVSCYSQSMGIVIKDVVFNHGWFNEGNEREFLLYPIKKIKILE